jgi:hypothetical protein
MCKTISVFLLAIFCESSFAFIDPIAIKSGNDIVVHMHRTEIPCPAEPNVTTCADYGLFLTAWIPDF